MHKFLTNTFNKDHNKVIKFSGSDTRELFNENKKTQPAGWYYHTNDVTYTLNSDYYRTHEWDTIDWAESIVLFGDSFAAGVGLDDKDTISHQLELMTGRQVVNLGVGGSSSLFSLQNSLILAEHYPVPHGVVYLWSGTDRLTYYSLNNIIHMGSWMSSPLYEEWNKCDENTNTHSNFIALAAKHMWLKKTKFYQATFFNETSKATNCTLLRKFDNARDCHTGRLTANMTAQQIKSNLDL